ncbi:unnamed protein product [Didymodactylos carnosus]|uniref:Uncharacterized protein n=1 Tax=Didymodactylos carnosus TaxID=1234261 RepID=A0A815SF69_9BILA|nr:unnamed protein product [Didymodactylos carnosus]CAF4354493.1 unnamed protein product [Didymodactylos carnosus]
MYPFALIAISLLTINAASKFQSDSAYGLSYLEFHEGLFNPVHFKSSFTNFRSVKDSHFIRNKTLESDKTFFWSGLCPKQHYPKCNCDYSQGIAKEIALYYGGHTLEMLDDKQNNFGLPNYDFDDTTIREKWIMLSKEYAYKARGTVRLIKGNCFNVNGVYQQYELKQLKENRKNGIPVNFGETLDVADVYCNKIKRPKNQQAFQQFCS